MTSQADWVKEFRKKFVGYPEEGVIHPISDFGTSFLIGNPDELESFISKVELLAQQRTEKKWREKIMRVSIPSCPISCEEYPPTWWMTGFGLSIKEYFGRKLGDLLEE